MLSVYDAGQKYPVTNATDFYVTHADGGLDTLDFTIPTDDPIYAHLAEENRVEYGDNDYNIKSIDVPGSSANIGCEINLDFLRANFHKAYDSGSVTLSALLGSVLPAGWTAAGYDPGISRTISLENATDYDVMKQAMSTYSVAFQWKTLQKILTVVNPADKTPSGEYLTDELNLRSIAFKGESKDFCTRLYPYGKDGLTIATVNGGQEYIENHQYSNKVICGYWSDDRYTIPENLKADAEERLASLSVPARSYDCDVIDLAKLDGRYSDFAFSMYKIVTLIDRQRGLQLDHQIMEYKEYPDEPQKNVLTLSSVVPTVQDNVDQAQQAADDAQKSADEANASIEILNGQITLKADKANLVAEINISPESIKISANKLELSGLVTIEGVESGETEIDGACIRTGRVESKDGKWWLDLETGQVFMSDGTFAGAIQWDENSKITHSSNGATFIYSAGDLNLAGGNGQDGQVVISGSAHIHVLDSEEIDTGTLNVSGTLNASGNITSGGATGKSETVPVKLSDGSVYHMQFIHGLYVAGNH